MKKYMLVVVLLLSSMQPAHAGIIEDGICGYLSVAGGWLAGVGTLSLREASWLGHVRPLTSAEKLAHPGKSWYSVKDLAYSHIHEEAFRSDEQIAKTYGDGGLSYLEWSFSKVGNRTEVGLAFTAIGATTWGAWKACKALGSQLDGTAISGESFKNVSNGVSGTAQATTSTTSVGAPK